MRRLPAHPDSVLALAFLPPGNYPGNGYAQDEQPYPVSFQEARLCDLFGRGNGWGGFWRLDRRRFRLHNWGRCWGGWHNFGRGGLGFDHFSLWLLNYRLGLRFRDGYWCGLRFRCRLRCNFRCGRRFNRCGNFNRRYCLDRCRCGDGGLFRFGRATRQGQG